MSKSERLKRVGEVFLIPFESIVVSDEMNNARVDFGDLQELATSIEESGLKIPLTVKKVRGEDKYVLVQGKRRLKAIEILIEKGIEFAGVKCLLAPPSYSIENSLFDQIVMNDGKPYSNIEQGIVFSQLVDRGYTVAEIARKIGKSNTHITNCLDMAALPKKIRTLIIEGSVSGLTAVNLAKVVDDENELITQLENAVETAETTPEGKKKKVTNKNVEQVASLSPLKKLETVKFQLEENEENVNVQLREFFFKLVSRLKAKEDVDSLLELFKK